MAVIKAINSKASIGRAINYILDKEKTDNKLVYGKDCNPKSAIDEMKATKELWNKKGGREYIHLVQSFDPLDKVSFEQAHEIGQEFINSCEKYKGYEVIMATHTNKNHVHNHFIINSVSFENGKKLNTSKKELQEIKDLNNKICKYHGLSIPKKKDMPTAYSKEKYKALEKGMKGQYNSYVLSTAEDVVKSLEVATNREEFFKLMNEKGYKVTWTDTRKHVTFENKDGKKVRNTNLEKTLKDSCFSKNSMENKLKENSMKKEATLKKNINREPIKELNIGKKDIVKSIEKVVKEIERSNNDKTQEHDTSKKRERKGR